MNKHGDDSDLIETIIKEEENYKEGGTGDLNTTETLPLYKKDNNLHLTLSAIYNKLTTSFQPLAEEISKHPQLANMLHGFIVKAQQLLCDAKANELTDSFLQLFNSTTKKLTHLDSKINESESTSSIFWKCNPITRPPPIGCTKTKQYKSLSETIMNSSKKVVSH